MCALVTGVQTCALPISSKNWELPVHGGPKGQTFFDTNFSMCPECIVLEAEPTGYPRAPVGKKRVWIDVRNQQFVAYITFDRRGEMWKSFELGWSRHQDGKAIVKDATGNSDWSGMGSAERRVGQECVRTGVFGG